jgi:hypothetical protein
MILARYIKQDRYYPTLIRTTQLVDLYGNPISIAKYSFNSSKREVNVQTYLQKDGYYGKQYIGFFQESSIQQNQPTHAMFRSGNLFEFNITDVKLKNPNVNLVGIDDVRLESVIRVIPNQFQFFYPPVYTDEGSVAQYSNAGEVDIVAEDMDVYGILFTVVSHIYPSFVQENLTNSIMLKAYVDMYNHNKTILNNMMDTMQSSGHFIGLHYNYLPPITSEDIGNIYKETIVSVQGHLQIMLSRLREIVALLNAAVGFDKQEEEDNARRQGRDVVRFRTGPKESFMLTILSTIGVNDTVPIGAVFANNQALNKYAKYKQKYLNLVHKLNI